MSVFTLETLERLVEERGRADASVSYTRTLLADGPERCAKKLGEEGVEVALAVAAGERQSVVRESADLLYHLLVALRVREIGFAEVLAELERRTAQSGLAERAARAEKS